MAVMTTARRFAAALALVGAFLIAGAAPAGPVKVKHREGTSHGFLVVRSVQGEAIAAGEMVQTLKGERVISRLTLRFNDGSLHDETTVYSQHDTFRLISDHLIQRGASFPQPVDVLIDAAGNSVRVQATQDGRPQSAETHFQIPADDANGLLLTFLENLPPQQATTVPMVIAAAKPRLIELEIHSAGNATFVAGGQPLKAVHYVVHPHIGGLAGAFASLIGRQPADVHYWLSAGEVPTFLKYRGALFDRGPTWEIELSAARLSVGAAPHPLQQ